MVFPALRTSLGRAGTFGSFAVRARRPVRLPSIVVLAVSALLAACGSDGDGPSQVDKVTVNPLEAAVEVGKTVSLTAQLFDASAKTVSGSGVQWSTSDASVATVSKTGVVTGVASGVARITAAAGSVSASALVSVSTSTSQTVSASGGTVSTPGGEVKVVVPNGSLPQGARITIEPVTTSPAGTTVPGTVYKIGVFGVIVGPRPTITVRYSVVGLPPGFDETKLTLSRKVGAFWVPLPSQVNTTEKTITATLPAGSSSVSDAASFSTAAALDEEIIVGATLLGFEVEAGSIQLTVGDRRTVTGHIRAFGSGSTVTPTSPNAVSSATGVATVSGTAVSGNDIRTDITAVAPGTAVITLSGVATGASGAAENFAGTITVTVVPQSALTVNVGGLPSGVNAAVTVTGPNGFSRTLTATATIPNVAPGTYTIAAQNVSASGQTYAPSPPSQQVNIAAGESKTVNVSYGGTLGALTVTVTGLPSGAAAAVTLSGPNGFNANVTQTQTLSSLAVGTYTIQANNVSAGGDVYAPTPPTQSVSVTPGQTATTTVAYAIASGSLAVTVSGLPAGTNAAVVVSGPNGFTRNVTASQTLSGLAPGSYTVTASNVTVGTQVYIANPASRAVTVAVGQSASATVTYALAPGNLTINVAGLPAGVAAAIVVTGPGGFSRTVTATTTITGLTPATYTTTASNVTSGDQVYAPNPVTQNSPVTSAQTAVANVTYALAGTAPDVDQSTLDACPAAIPVSAGSTIRVSARSASGGAIPGARVLLSVSGTGNQLTSSLTTDASGNASTPFSSSVAQAKTVTAQITSAGTTISKNFSLGVFGAQSATQLVKISGDNQTIPVGTAGAPFVVETRNPNGIPVANIPVTWTFSNCFFTTTGANGRTQAFFVAPYRASPGGPFTITAAIPGGPSVSFTYTYVAGASGSSSSRVSKSSVLEPSIPAGRP